jgi:O-antigen/teichoic acid export membrane protein
VPPSLGPSATRAGMWRVASMAAQGSLQLGVGILLARMLPAADFGILALAMVVIGLATVVSDLGLAPAIVQRDVLTVRLLRVAFTASLLFGGVLACILFLLAPALAALTRSAALTPVLRVLSLLFIFAGAGANGRAILQRKLDFHAQFKIDVTSYVIGYALVAVGCALCGLGVWSLVFGSLMQNLLSSWLSLTSARVPLRPLLSSVELRELLGFGSGVSIARIVSYAGRNGDNFLVGRLLGVTLLGYYARAFNLMMMPVSYVSSAMPLVLLPTMSRILEEPRRVGQAYLMSIQLAMLISAPVMAGMFVAAPALVNGLYGRRWGEAVLPLQILCFSGLVRGGPAIAGAVNYAFANVLAELRLQLTFAASIIIGSVIGARSGIAGVAVFVDLANALMYLGGARMALALTGTTWRAFGLAQIPGVIVGVVTASCTVPVRFFLDRAGFSPLAELLLLVVVSALSLPLGIFSLSLLPPAIRPIKLFEHLSAPLRRLPRRLGQPVLALLRVAG